MRIFVGCLIFILGVFSSVLIHFIGDFYVTEVLLIALFPFLALLEGRRLLRPSLKKIFLLLGLWFVGLVLSDAYRQTEIINRLRGMALIGFFVVLIATFSIILTGDERQKIIFLTAYAIGSVVVAKISPTETRESDIRWKFGYANGTIILVVLVSCYFYARRKYVPAALCLAAIAGYNLLVNYRSAFLEIMITAVLVVPIIPERIGRFRLLPRKRGLVHVLIVTVLALGAGWSASKILTYASSAGYLTDQAKEKNEAEAKAGNLILGGRREFFVGLRAVADSPILGHGSWPSDRKYAEMMADMEAETGVRMNWNEEIEANSGLIPAHSHIVGAWVFAGILGVPFWAYLLWLVARATVQVAILRPPLAPIYCYLFITLFWAILFSPFGSWERIFEAVTIVIIIDLLEPRTVSASKPSLVRKARWRRSGSVRPSLIASHRT